MQYLPSANGLLADRSPEEGWSNWSHFQGENIYVYATIYTCTKKPSDLLN